MCYVLVVKKPNGIIRLIMKVNPPPQALCLQITTVNFVYCG